MASRSPYYLWTTKASKMALMQVCQRGKKQTNDHAQQSDTRSCAYTGTSISAYTYPYSMIQHLEEINLASTRVCKNMTFFNRLTGFWDWYIKCTCTVLRYCQAINYELPKTVKCSSVDLVMIIHLENICSQRIVWSQELCLAWYCDRHFSWAHFSAFLIENAFLQNKLRLMLRGFL